MASDPKINVETDVILLLAQKWKASEAAVEKLRQALLMLRTDSAGNCWCSYSAQSCAGYVAHGPKCIIARKALEW